MSDQPMRKTQARLAYRERRQKREEQKQKLLKIVPFMLVGLLAVLGAGMLIYSSSQASSDIAGAKGPRLQLDREQIDLGDQHFGTTVRASFRVTNVGDGTLKLDLPKVATVVQGC